jgi:hypothetical protein
LDPLMVVRIHQGQLGVPYTKRTFDVQASILGSTFSHHSES